MANMAKDPELAAEEVDNNKFASMTDEERNAEWDKKLPITGNQTGKWCAITTAKPKKIGAAEGYITPFDIIAGPLFSSATP